MTDSRWVRVNVDWDQSDWLYDLTPAARLAWIMLIARAKTLGFSGTFKAASVRVLAETWRIPVADVKAMLDAAFESNALRNAENGSGSWTITKWQEYQGDTGSAERQRRHREAKKSFFEPKRNGSNALRNDVTPTETETETDSYYQNSAGARISESPSTLPSRSDAQSGVAVAQPGLGIQTGPREFPPEFRSAKLDSAWSDFKRHRAQAGQAAYTAEGIEKLVIQCQASNLGPDELAKVVNSAIVNNALGIKDWAIKRFWADRQKPAKPARSSRAETPTEMYERLQRETAMLTQNQTPKRSL